MDRLLGGAEDDLVADVVRPVPLGPGLRCAVMIMRTVSTSNLCGSSCRSYIVAARDDVAQAPLRKDDRARRPQGPRGVFAEKPLGQQLRLAVFRAEPGIEGAAEIERAGLGADHEVVRAELEARRAAPWRSSPSPASARECRERVIGVRARDALKVIPTTSPSSGVLVSFSAGRFSQMPPSTTTRSPAYAADGAVRKKNGMPAESMTQLMSGSCAAS